MILLEIYSSEFVQVLKFFGDHLEDYSILGDLYFWLSVLKLVDNT